MPDRSRPHPARRRPAVQTPAPLRDARLVALLMYLSGTNPDDERDGRQAAAFAEAQADARTLLSRRPLTSAFDDTLGRRTFAPFVRAAITHREPDLKPFIDRVFDGAIDESHDVAAPRGDVRLLLDVCIEAAVLRGAVLMYLLAEGGLR